MKKVRFFWVIVCLLAGCVEHARVERRGYVRRHYYDEPYYSGGYVSHTVQTYERDPYHPDDGPRRRVYEVDRHYVEPRSRRVVVHY